MSAVTDLGLDLATLPLRTMKAYYREAAECFGSKGTIAATIVQEGLKAGPGAIYFKDGVVPGVIAMVTSNLAINSMLGIQLSPKLPRTAARRAANNAAFAAS